jgi:pimeloyl-ACP methyl ester carboxylesterase
MTLISEIALPVRHRGIACNLSAWFRDSGHDLIVFVHGLGCSKENWRLAWERRELRDKSLLAIDFPGFGHSPRPPEFRYDLEDLAALLADVIDAYASRSIHLVAHSMGGTVALLLPIRTLARFQGLMLVEPRLVQSSCGIASEAAQTTQTTFETDLLPRFRQRISVDPRSAFDLDRADPEAIYKSSCSLIRWTQGTRMFDRFAAAPCPKYFMYGGLDRHLEELGLIDAENKIEIPNAGHFVMQDEPDSFYGRLGALLSAS